MTWSEITFLVMIPVYLVWAFYQTDPTDRMTGTFLWAFAVFLPLLYLN